MLKKLRLICQGVLLALVLVFAYLHTIDNIYPSSHALCPFGGLASLYSLVTTGTFVHRTHASSLFLLLAVVLTALLAGRVFCAWLCPLGTLGEWVHKLGRRIGIKRPFVPPAPVDRALRYTKYLILALLLYFTWSLGHLFYREACPWAAFMTIFEPEELVEDVLIGGGILLAVLGASVYIERFFCRYLCPMGAALAIFNRFSLIKPLRDVECRGCQACDRVCPSGVQVSRATRVHDGDCIRCYACLDTCPEKGSLTLNLKRLKPALAGFLAVLVFAGTVLVSAQAGYWEKGRTLSRVSGQGEGVGQGTGTGMGQGIDQSIEGSDIPAALLEELQSIRATTTLQEISDAFPIPLEELYSLLEIAENFPPESTVRDIGEAAGVTRGQLLRLLAEYLNSSQER